MLRDQMISRRHLSNFNRFLSRSRLSGVKRQNCEELI